jgi:GDPmannose 4,6-dehydratase
MLQQDQPDDFVLATGDAYSIRDFLDLAFDAIGIAEWESYVIIDPRFYRPAEVDVLRGDYSKAKDILDWQPKVKLKEMVTKMVVNDLRILRRE